MAFMTWVKASTMTAIVTAGGRVLKATVFGLGGGLAGGALDGRKPVERGVDVLADGLGARWRIFLFFDPAKR